MKMIILFKTEWLSTASLTQILKELQQNIKAGCLWFFLLCFLLSFFFLFYFSVLFNFCNTLPRRSSRNSYLWQLGQLISWKWGTTHWTKQCPFTLTSRKFFGEKSGALSRRTAAHRLAEMIKYHKNNCG